jgi:hypothetical protein
MTMLRAITLALLLTALVEPPAAKAGLLRPLLDLMRPNLERRLSQACVSQLAGDDPALGKLLEQPCRQVASPTSRCLIEETDHSGRGLGVLTEMLAGRFGDDSEVVVKRCIARQLGLPAGSLQDLPLRELIRRYASRSRT